MTEETTQADPFAPSTETSGKTRFVSLKLHSNPVVLKSGASYEIKGVNDRDGNTKQWRGKELDPKSKRRHIVLQATATDKDGNDYTMLRDHLDNDKAYKAIVGPSLVKAFNGKYPTAAPAFVEVQEVETGEHFPGTDRDTGEPKQIAKTAWKIVKVFATKAAMKAAEDEFFSKFNGDSNGNGSTAPAVNLPDGWNDAKHFATKLAEWKKDIAADKTTIEAVADKFGIDVEFLRKALA